MIYLSEDAVLQLWRELCDPARRVAYCRAIVADRVYLKRERKIFSKDIRASTRILGCDYKTARTLFTARIDGQEFAAAAASLPTECPSAWVGYVYWAESPTAPGVFKIGFSANPERRLRELISTYKTDLQFAKLRPGTFLDEYAQHRAFAHCLVAQKWFTPFGERPYPDFIRRIHGGSMAEGVTTYMRALGMEPEEPMASVWPRNAKRISKIDRPVGTA